MVTKETNDRVLDVVRVGELIIDFVSVEQTGPLDNATTFRRYRGGSLACTAPYVSRLRGTSAVIATTGTEAFGEFLKGLLSRNAPYRRAETPAKPRA